MGEVRLREKNKEERGERIATQQRKGRREERVDMQLDETGVGGWNNKGIIKRIEEEEGEQVDDKGRKVRGRGRGEKGEK